MSIRAIAGWGMVALGAFAIANALVEALGGAEDAATLPSATLVTELSQEQEEEATEIVAADPRLRELIGDTPYRPADVIAWSRLDGQTLVGAVMTLELAEPVTASAANWPVMIAEAAGAPVRAKSPYITRTARLSVKNATEIMASVDLRKSTVLGLMPGGPKSKIEPIKFYGSPPGPGFRAPEGY